jgi:hypothetical protein
MQKQQCIIMYINDVTSPTMEYAEAAMYHYYQSNMAMAYRSLVPLATVMALLRRGPGRDQCLAESLQVRGS